MYIIAKKSEKDYYDGVVGTTGIDKTIVYDRKPIELEGNDIPEFFQRKRNFFKKNKNDIHDFENTHVRKEYRKKYPRIAFFVVGFCGKLYIGWKLYHEINKMQENNTHNVMITEITYDADFIKTIVEPEGWHTNFNDDMLKIKNYNVIQLSRDLKAPIFIYDSDYERTWLDDQYSRKDSKFFVNPFFLSDYEFYKVFNAFQAFQEISMFISGVLGRGEKEIIEVEDKYKIQQHGFDKWSFRKEPQSKKSK